MKNDFEVRSRFYKIVIDNMRDIRAERYAINFEIVRSITREAKIEDQEYFETMKLTDYAVKRFLSDDGLNFQNLHGEVLSADLSSVDSYRNFFLENICKDFLPENIFNLDEASLCIKGMTDKSYVIDSNKGSVKQNKTRVTSASTLA